MQDPRSEHRKGESPFQKANKENPPLRCDTEGRRGSGSRRKENSPLHTANWQSSLHRKSHLGVNWRNQDNPAAVPDPLPSSRQRPTHTAPWNSPNPRRPYKQARRSKGKQVRARTLPKHIPWGASSLTLHYLSSTFKEELLPSKQLLTKELLPCTERHIIPKEELLPSK